ncbi:hypothetical protein T265_07546 [Opisthorchis viverrini]|uniref:long-chain-fatty-acid--CoA ligase n=1 Tax=Opisthorchis viverrini TaxID=6198 RepID=A0A075AB73_OPIVI|nr:hypothetical protein T265_07546 [Opisthorchis viverrini]KER24869.1 hypothetical protein T265_07546 [Opisthorchis viverrini]
MSENQSTKLKINYDVNCQSKVVDEDKGVRVSPIEWTKAEQNVKNMRAFVDYIGDKHAKLRTVVCDTVERAESLLDWANHHIQCLIIIKMDDNDRKKLETKFTASIEIHSFHEVIVSCTTKTKFFVQTWMAVAVYATLDEGENYNQEVKEPNPNDLFLVCYTSGSTGLPKGVTYTHSTFLQGMSIAYRSLALMEISTDCHAHVSFLPMAHIMEQIFMVILHLFRQSICLRLGARIAFLTNDTSGLMEDYAYYRPTLICTVPRVLSRLYTEVMRVVNTNKIKAQLFQLAVGVKTAEQSRSTYFLGFRTQLVEAYGSTEVGGLATVSLPLDTTGGHAGSVAPEVYIKLIDVPSMGFVVRRDAVGEICVKSPAVTPGYFKDEEQTRGLFDKDGYVRMGDIGRWTDRGTLQIVDRVKNIFKLSQGEYVAPEKVEQIYALSPLVTNVYVEGNALYPYAVGVVVPNLQEIERQFPQQLPSDGVQHTESEKSREKTSVPLLDLNQEKNLTKLLIDELNRIGSAGGLKGFEQIRAVHLSDEPFSVANGLLTPTMKIARPQLRQKFAHHIQALYDAGDS